MALGDTYKLVTFANYLGKTCQNRYFYQQIVGTSPGAGSMHSAFFQDVFPVIQSLQVDGLVWDKIEIINLDNPADYGVFSAVNGQTGVLAGPNSPSFNAWAFELIRSTRNIRSGRKSLAGVDESTTDGNGPTVTFGAVLDAAANIFGIPIDNDGGDVYQPMLVRLGPADTILYSEGVSSAIFKRLSTQNSRK